MVNNTALDLMHKENTTNLYRNETLDEIITTHDSCAGSNLNQSSKNFVKLILEFKFFNYLIILFLKRRVHLFGLKIFKELFYQLTLLDI